MSAPKTLTPGQRAYEARRAARAGVSLEAWLAQKARETEAAARAEEHAARRPAAPKAPGLISRLLDRAHKPL